MNYYPVTHDYLKRAREQLDSKSMSGIFYAAFELRCGIESRMFRYLEARENITKLKRKGWRIARMNAQIEGTFKTRGKICVITFQDQRVKLPINEFKYIPISRKLKTMAEKLGNYLHAQTFYRKHDDAWWDETRNYMEIVYDELAYVASGTLMGAPLMNPKNNAFHLEIEFPREAQENLQIVKDAFLENTQLNVKVEYVTREEIT